MISLVTKSAEDTRELAAAVSCVVNPGDVLLLVGELGAGKTTFAQGFGRGLGVSESITSPTFVLLRSYQGRLDLLHADVYRLDQLQEVLELGLAELVDDGGVALVEWGDMAAPALGPDVLEVRIAERVAGHIAGHGEAGAERIADHGEPDAGEDERRIELRPVGRSWMGRREALELAVDRWRSR